MKERVAEELAKRQQEIDNLKNELQELNTRLQRGQELIVMKNGAIQQLRLLLSETDAGNSDVPSSDDGGEIGAPPTNEG